jgi:hypothetical protein
MHDSARFVERLPEGWDNYLYMWLFPQPSIAPTQVLIIYEHTQVLNYISILLPPFENKLDFVEPGNH